MRGSRRRRISRPSGAWKRRPCWSGSRSISNRTVADRPFSWSLPLKNKQFWFDTRQKVQSFTTITFLRAVCGIISLIIFSILERDLIVVVVENCYSSTSRADQREASVSDRGKQLRPRNSTQPLTKDDTEPGCLDNSFKWFLYCFVKSLGIKFSVSQ